MCSKSFVKQAALGVIVAVGLCAGPACAQGGQPGTVEEVLPIAEAQHVAESIIPAQDVPGVEKSAMRGSAKDAVRLARHFGTQADWAKQVFWLTIAVENGDRDQRLDLARAYRRDLDPFSLQRAQFWYESLIRDGTPELAALARTEIDHVKHDIASHETKAAQ
jgi:hypothetical protein